jgi:hypothetical protein
MSDDLIVNDCPTTLEDAELEIIRRRDSHLRRCGCTLSALGALIGRSGRPHTGLEQSSHDMARAYDNALRLLAYVHALE